MGRRRDLVLSTDDRARLQSWAAQQHDQGLAVRAQALLDYADGRQATEIALRGGFSQSTLSLWRDRFLADRLTGLMPNPRGGWQRRRGTIPVCPPGGQIDSQNWVCLTPEESDALHRAAATARGIEQSAAARARSVQRSAAAVAVDGLDERHRAVLLLRVDNPSMPLADLAALMGVDRRRVATRLRVALAAADQLAVKRTP